MTDKYTPGKGDYISMQGGKKYLPARRRVQWFRGDHPDWTIHTSVIELNWAEGFAIIRGEILDDTGRLIASGMKSETRKGFADFVEKAETGAIARAVAIAGYGTEDALDLDEGERIADGPVTKQPERSRGAQASNPNAAAPVRSPEEQALADELLALTSDRHEFRSQLADAVGVPKGTRANAEQLRQMIALAVDAAAGVEPVVARATGEVEASDGSDPSDALPPRPGSEPYKALAVQDKASARAYWAKHDTEPQQESLAEALGAPAA